MRGVQQPSRSEITTPTGSIPNACNGYFRILDPQPGGPLYKNHSHNSRVPLAILLLKIKHQNETECTIMIHLSVIFRL